MNQDDRNRHQGNPGNESTRGGDITREDKNREDDLQERQREGNLGNERTRNQPDAERRPGGDRENLNR
jgi:hypothetical protein